MRQDCRALIVGCGIAGPVLEVALRLVGITATIVEADRQPRDSEGAFLGLAPNGLNVLKSLGLLEPVHDVGLPLSGMAFFNERGRRIGTINYGDQQRLYGV
ncbi:MAG TPA: FAD-dependent monooxygenase, partial [Vineibacter sp.]|nr:FAD-dependent monooxygenase [Vineibacter sp.]